MQYNRLTRYILILITPIMFTACSSTQAVKVIEHGHSSKQALISPSSVSHHPHSSTQQLIQTARSYLGTPYQYGGNNLHGIDCSGLVTQSFKSVGVEMPRVSRLQAQRGYQVTDDQLREGDLVFFATHSPKRINHVGILVDQQSFIHASSSKGVMISRLDNPYWKKRYRLSRRIIDASQ